MKYINHWIFLFLITLIFVNGAKSQSTVERIKVYGPSLEGNLSGDSPERDVSIYLPPSYHQQLARNYPVVYMLHGFTDDDARWFGFQEHWINLPEILDQALEAGNAQEMIVVMPNAYNRFKGSMYSTSMTVGDWETFVAQELVAYIDSHYRTLPKATSRGLAGHSMGGYGTIRIGMKFPEVFANIYLLSPCCMEPNFSRNEGLMLNVEKVSKVEELEEQPFFVIATLATAAAWAPNPNNPPFYFDLPFKDGKIIQEIDAKFAANATLTVIDKHIPALKKLNAIGMDAGNQDWGISSATKKLDQILLDYQIPHEYEAYEGDHTNRIAERILTKVLPFFSKHLVSQ